MTDVPVKYEPWPFTPGRYLRLWVDRFGKSRRRVVLVKGASMFDLVEVGWTDLPSRADAGSWVRLGDLDERIPVDGEETMDTPPVSEEGK